MKSLLRGPVPLLVIVFLCVAVYANSFFNKFLYDDEALIVNNPFIRSWNYIGEVFTSTLFAGADYPTNYYRPLQTITFLLDYSLWQLHPAGYHLTNLILHSLCACLTFLLIKLLLGNAKIALLAGILFAVHPIHTQAVTYVSGRADPLAALFMLLSLFLFVKTTRRAGKGEFRVYAASLVSFAFALLTKEIALVFPLAVILVDNCFPASSPKSNIIRKSPRYYPAYFVIAAVYLLLRTRLLTAAEQGALSNVPALSVRLLTTAKVIFIYLGLLCLPLNLHMERNVSLVGSLSEPAGLFPVIGLAVIAVLIVRSYRYSRSVFFAGAWFFLHLLAVANIFPLVAPMAEHWLYVPSIGFFLLLALIEQRLSRRRQTCFKVLTPAVLIILICFYSCLTVRRNRDWKDDLTFYRHTLRYSPHSARIHTGLGVAYQREGMLEKAAAEYETAIRLNPDYPEAHNNLGAIYRKQGMLEEAAAEYETALKLQPNSATFHFNLGNLLDDQGLTGEAIEHYLVSLKLNPHYPETYFALGTAYLNKNLPEKAIAEYQRALSLRPDYPAALNNLGYLYVEQELDLKEGILLIERALASAPDNPAFLDSLGWAHYRQGDRQKAYHYLKRATALDPENLQIREHLQEVESGK